MAEDQFLFAIVILYICMYILLSRGGGEGGGKKDNVLYDRKKARRCHAADGEPASSFAPL